MHGLGLGWLPECLLVARRMLAALGSACLAGSLSLGLVEEAHVHRLGLMVALLHLRPEFKADMPPEVMLLQQQRQWPQCSAPQLLPCCLLRCGVIACRRCKSLAEWQCS